MAFVYWTRGRLDDARQECRIAREKDPALAKANEMLAVLEQPAHAHDKGGPAGRGKPLTAAQREEAEHEAARRAVARLSGAAPAPPVPSGVTPAPADGGVWQSSAPIVQPSGRVWMPVNAGAAPAVSPPCAGASDRRHPGDDHLALETRPLAARRQRRAASRVLAARRRVWYAAESLVGRLGED